MSVLVAGKCLLSDCDGVCVTDVVWAVVWEATHSVAGWSRRSKAAASGRAASITTLVSGRAARGSGG